MKRTLRYVIQFCHVEIYEGNVEDFYDQNMDAAVSMVFIDAYHDYHSVKRDIAWAVSVGCKGISGHDYLDIHAGVKRAVDEHFGDNFKLFGSVWVHISN